MNEYLQNINSWLISALIALLGLMWKQNDNRHRSAAGKMANLGSQLRALQTDTVTHDTLTNFENDWREEISRMREDRKENHAENTRRLDSIDRTLMQVVEIAVAVRSVQQEIGTHESGLRGQLHLHRDNLVRLAGKVPGGLDVIE